MAKLQGPKERIYPSDVHYSSGGRPRCIETQKTIWDDKQMAKIQAEHYRKRYGHKMNAYFCELCRGWHIGHKLYHRRKLYLLKKQKKHSYDDVDIMGERGLI